MSISGVDVAREFIRLLIDRRGMNLKDFGAKVGIPDSSLCDMLNGKRRVHFVHLDKIGAAMGMRLSDVLGEMADIAAEHEEER